MPRYYIFKIKISSKKKLVWDFVTIKSRNTRYSAPRPSLRAAPLRSSIAPASCHPVIRVSNLAPRRSTLAGCMPSSEARPFCFCSPDNGLCRRRNKCGSRSSVRFPEEMLAKAAGARAGAGARGVCSATQRFLGEGGRQNAPGLEPQLANWCYELLSSAASP